MVSYFSWRKLPIQLATVLHNGHIACSLILLPLFYTKKKKTQPSFFFKQCVCLYSLYKSINEKVKKRDILRRYEFSMQQFKYPQQKLTSTQWQWLLRCSYALSKKQNIYIYDHNYKKLCNFFEFIWKNANVLCEKPAEGPTEFPSSHHNNTVVA